jgi:hypothetical protein
METALKKLRSDSVAIIRLLAKMEQRFTELEPVGAADSAL